METFSYYRSILDEIFGGIEKFARNRIRYEVVVGLNDTHDSFQLTSVNGFSDPEKYHQAVLRLLFFLWNDIKDVLGNFRSNEAESFLADVAERLEKLKKIVEVREVVYCKKSRITESHKEYSFNIPLIYNDYDPAQTEIIPVAVVIQASGFARCWRKALKETIGRVRGERVEGRGEGRGEIREGLEGFDDFEDFEGVEDFGDNKDIGDIEDYVESGKSMILDGKIKVQRSVDQLGAYLKMLYSVGVFGDLPKTQLSCFFAGNFRTKKQNHISAASLKNHLDNPSEEAINFIKSEFNQMKANFATWLMPWVLGPGRWVLGCWGLGAGFWVLGPGFWGLGAGFRATRIQFLPRKRGPLNLLISGRLTIRIKNWLCQPLFLWYIYIQDI